MDDQKLDELLGAWRVEPASTALRDAVLSTAPKARASGWRAWFGVRDARLWLTGAGLAAGVAGISCGVAFAAVSVREARDEALVSAVATAGSTSISSFAEPAQVL